MNDPNTEKLAASAASEETAAPKTKAKHATKTDDVLVQIVQDISKLSAEQAIDVVPLLLDGADENYFRLGGVLSLISAQKYYEKEGFKDFRTFVEQKFGIQYRKAMYWVHIYDKLIESNVPWNKVKTVGWTKLKDLAAILTIENVDEWVQRALNSTVLQLQEAIAKAKSGTLEKSGIEPTEDTKSATTTVTFKVHQDQKTIINEAIEKAMKEAETEYTGVALESICMNYLSGGNVGLPPLAGTLSKYTPEDIVAAMEQAFPDVQITVKIGAKKSAA